MNFERQSLRVPRNMLLVLAVVGGCGELRTYTDRPDYTIDPSAQDRLPEHDLEADWPTETLPTSVILTATGGARYLRDYVYVRVLNQAGLTALLAAHDFLHVAQPLQFTNAHGDLHSVPWPDLVFQEDGIVAERAVDVIVEVDWDRLNVKRFSGVEIPFSNSAQYTFDSERALALMQVLVWMNEHDSEKVIAIEPIVLALDPDDATVEVRASLDAPTCSCVVPPVNAPHRLYDARLYDLNPAGELDLLDCSRDLLTSGYDLLMVREATVSDSWEFWNAEQKIKMWVVPAEDHPFSLPGGSSLYVSLWSTNIQFEKHVPPHAHNGTLPGPIRPGESAYCEWDKNDIPYTLDYRNTGVWAWQNDGTDPWVGVLFYETDEEKCLIGNFLCGGSPDDFIEYIAPLSRAATLESTSRGTNGVEVVLETIDECRLASDEACNGLDDDCNDETDEPEVAEVGEQCSPDWTTLDQLCVPGSKICTAEGAIDCVGFITPSAEKCNNVNDDCDDETDEDTPNAGMLCGVDIGVCKPGEIVCQNGVEECEGALGAAGPEQCGNGLDDNCDGAVDEGCPCQPGDEIGCGISQGSCTIGMQVCVQGQWSDCSGVGPVPEVCDGEDNNCNGETDEGLLNACGECGPEPVEICNYEDDDCDDLTDEDENDQEYGLQNSCMKCAPEPLEICNDFDDDCDTLIDEDLTNCGVTYVEKPFSLNGASENDVIVIDKPPFDWTIPFVFVDEYNTGGDDDFEYEISWTANANQYSFSLHTDIGDGQSSIVGRLGVLAGGPNVPTPASSYPLFKSDQACPVALGSLNLNIPDARVMTGTRVYKTSADDDFSFRMWEAPDDPAVELFGCGWIGNGGSEVRSWSHLIDFPATVIVKDVTITAWNNSPQLSNYDMSDAVEVFPLIAVTEYDTNDDDDANWRIDCGGPPAQYHCAVEVSGGNDGSNVTVRGVLLGVMQ